MPTGGGSLDVLLSLQGFPSSIVEEGATLYVTTYGQKVLAVPKNGGPHTTLATSAGVFVSGIAIGGASVYWTSGPTIRRVPAVGGPAEVIVAESYAVGGLAVRGGFVYWTTHSPGSSTSGMIKRAALDGSDPTTLEDGLGSPGALAVDDDHVYVLDQGTGKVLRLPASGGPVTTIATGQIAPWRIAVDADGIYWIDKGNYAKENGSVWRMAK